MTEQDTRGVSWRDSMRPVRVYGFDARLLMLLVVWLFLPAWWTTALLVCAVAAFRIAEMKGYRFRAALRAVRAWSAGRRHALNGQRLRRFVDFG